MYPAPFYMMNDMASPSAHVAEHFIRWMTSNFQ